MMYILFFLLFVTGDHCSCFSEDRFQPDTAIFKSDGSDVYAYIHVVVRCFDHHVHSIYA